MKRVTQTIFGPPDGNCFAACVASILELPMDRVPNFRTTERPDGGAWHWLDRWRGWMAPANISLALVEYGSGLIPAGWSILSIDSPRFPGFRHAVVAWNGRPRWDPFPGADMAQTEDQSGWHHYYAFTTLDPTQPVALDALPTIDHPGYQTDAWGMPLVPLGGNRPGLTVRRR